MQIEEGRRKHLSGIQEQLGGQAWAQTQSVGEGVEGGQLRQRNSVLGGELEIRQHAETQRTRPGSWSRRLGWVWLVKTLGSSTGRWV